MTTSYRNGFRTQETYMLALPLAVADWIKLGLCCPRNVELEWEGSEHCWEQKVAKLGEHWRVF